MNVDSCDLHVPQTLKPRKRMLLPRPFVWKDSRRSFRITETAPRPMASVSQSGQKRLFDLWEPPEAAALFDEFAELHVVPDIVAEEENITSEIQRHHAKVQMSVAQWETQPTPVALRAISFVAMCVLDEAPWSSKSDLLMVNVVMLAYFSEIRAHSDGVYLYANGYFRNIEELPGSVLRALEIVVYNAGTLFRTLRMNPVVRDYDQVMEFLSTTHEDILTMAPLTSDHY